MSKWLSRFKENLPQIPGCQTDNTDVVRTLDKLSEGFSTVSVLSVPTLGIAGKNNSYAVLEGMCNGGCGYLLPFCNCRKN